VEAEELGAVMAHLSRFEIVAAGVRPAHLGGSIHPPLRRGDPAMKRNFAGTLTFKQVFLAPGAASGGAVGVGHRASSTSWLWSRMPRSTKARQSAPPWPRPMRNPAMTFMLGPGWGLDNYTIGAMVGHEMLLFAAMLAAIMNILVVQALTRSSEEDGRHEAAALPARGLLEQSGPPRWFWH